MLTPQGQDTMAAGMVRDVARHLIPSNAVYDAENVLLDNDGSAYKRAGSVYKNLGGGGSAGTKIRQMWDGLLAGGQRTFFATESKFLVLDSFDGAGQVLGGSGGTVQGARWVAYRDVLYGPGGVIYGGSRKLADYATGTVTATNGSTTVTGAGTLWLANVDVGMLLQIGGAGPCYVVKSVDSNTQITLKEAFQGATAGGLAYALKLLGTAVVPSSNFPAQFGGVAAVAFWAVVGNRLVVSDGSSRVWFSAVNNPYSFTSTDFHELPGGVKVTGLDRIRDTLIVFTTAGIFAVANMALALTDPAGNAQQRLARLSQDTILWGDPGIATWNDRLIVPTLRGVILLEANGSSSNVSGDPPYGISSLIRNYARLGFKPGGAAVYDGHYFLPIVSGDVVMDLLVCRMDRPAGRWRGRSFVTSFPWTRFSGYGSKVLAFAARGGQTSRPDLLGGSSVTDKMLQLRYTEPSIDTRLEADSSQFTFKLETRDHRVQPDEGKGIVRRCRLRYELLNAVPFGSKAPGDYPKIAGYVSVGAPVAAGAQYDVALYNTDVYASADVSEFVAMRGSAPEDDGRNPFTFTPGTDLGNGMLPGGVRARYVRFRFQSSEPAAKLIVREWTFWTRQSHKIT